MHAHSPNCSCFVILYRRGDRGSQVKSPIRPMPRQIDQLHASRQPNSGQNSNKAPAILTARPRLPKLWELCIITAMVGVVGGKGGNRAKRDAHTPNTGYKGCKESGTRSRKMSPTIHLKASGGGVGSPAFYPLLGVIC